MAYITGAREALLSIFSDPDKFGAAAPLTYLNGSHPPRTAICRAVPFQFAGFELSSSTQQDGQQNAQAQYEKPQGWRRRSRWTRTALFSHGHPWVEQQPSRVTLLQEQEHEAGRGSVNQVTNQRGQKR